MTAETTGKAARNAARTRSQTEVWIEYARHAATALRNRTPLPEITVYGPVLHAGERALFQGTVNYARMYGGDGTYNPPACSSSATPQSCSGLSRPPASSNHRRRARALRDAALQWRDHQNAGFIATNQRLMVYTGRGWGTYAYSAITEFYPDLDGWTSQQGSATGAHPCCSTDPPSPPSRSSWQRPRCPDRWMRDPQLRGIVGRPT